MQDLLATRSYVGVVFGPVKVRDVAGSPAERAQVAGVSGRDDGGYSSVHTLLERVHRYVQVYSTVHSLSARSFVENLFDGGRTAVIG